MKFSVVIPNWNGRHHLCECLDSLNGQTFKDFETIVVDNNSSDGSGDFVRAHYPWVMLVTLHENLGFAGGVNAGIRKAKGDFVVLLNNDTAADPSWLQALEAAIRDCPDVWIFASKLVNYFDRQRIDSAGDSMDLDLGPYKIGENEPVEKYNQRRFVFGACGGGGCYRRGLFEKIGFFDEDFFAYLEDVDLCFRANWAGFRCLFVPDAVIYHKVGGTAALTAETKLRFSVMTRRNYLMLIAKNYSPGMLLRHSVQLLIMLILKKFTALFKLRSSMRRRLSEAFCADFQFLRLWSRTMAKRQAIMDSRAISERDMEMICARPPGAGSFFLSVWIRRELHSWRASWSK